MRCAWQESQNSAMWHLPWGNWANISAGSSQCVLLFLCIFLIPDIIVLVHFAKSCICCLFPLSFLLPFLCDISLVIFLLLAKTRAEKASCILLWPYFKYSYAFLPKYFILWETQLCFALRAFTYGKVWSTLFPCKFCKLIGFIFSVLPESVCEAVI